MRLSSCLYRKLLALTVAALLISALAPVPALARASKPAPSSGQCLVTPNPVSNQVTNQLYTVVGSGFAPYLTVEVMVSGPSGTGIFYRETDSAGNFAVSDWAGSLADGQWTVSVYVAGGRRMTLATSCSFQVI